MLLHKEADQYVDIFFGESAPVPEGTAGHGEELVLEIFADPSRRPHSQYMTRLGISRHVKEVLHSGNAIKPSRGKEPMGEWRGVGSEDDNDRKDEQGEDSPEGMERRRNKRQTGWRRRFSDDRPFYFERKEIFLHARDLRKVLRVGKKERENENEEAKTGKEIK